MIKRFVHNFCVDVRYSIDEDFVSRTFKLRIYKEKLTWVQVLFKIRVINFVDAVVRINNWCPDMWAMLGVFMLTYSVKHWKVVIAMLTLESNDKVWASLIFSNMITEVSLESNGESRTLWVHYKVSAEHLVLCRTLLSLVVWVVRFSLLFAD